MTLHDQCRLCQVRIAGIGAAADENLLNRFLLHFLIGPDVVRLVGTGNQWFQGTEVNTDLLIIFGILIRQDLSEFFLPSLRPHKAPDSVVRRKNRSRRAHLSAHIGDRRPLRDFQRSCAGACVFIDLAEAAFNGFTPQHLQDNLLGVDPRPELSLQPDPDHPGHSETHWDPRHGRRHIHSSHSDGQHTDRSAVGSVAVSAHADDSRPAESGRVHSVADAVSGPGDRNPVPLRRRLQVDMIVRRLEINIKKIVIQIADTPLHADAVDSDRLKSQIGHHSIDVVCQCMVHTDKNILPSLHAARNKM